MNHIFIIVSDFNVFLPDEKNFDPLAEECVDRLADLFALVFVLLKLFAV